MNKPGRKGEIDEHDQTTEPLVMSPMMPTVPAYDNEVLPMPQPYEQPFPQQYVPVVPSWYPQPQDQRANKVYPYGAPPQQKGAAPPANVPAHPAQPAVAQSKRRSHVPRYVGMCFVLIQLLLLARFILKIFNPESIAPWMSTMYALTDLFLWPFQLFMQHIQMSLPGNLEIQTLLAILCYGLLSRITVRFLKMFMHSR